VQSAVCVRIDGSRERKRSRHGGVAERGKEHADEPDQVSQRHHALGFIPDETEYREGGDRHHEDHPVDDQVLGRQGAIQLFFVAEFF